MEFVKAVRISDQKGIMGWPSFSPNSEYIVYQKQEGNHVHIFQQRVGSSTAINLTRESDSDNLQPSYSPSGNVIAFRSSREGGGIFIMGATGESVRRVTNSGYFPSWSPDEKTLVFATQWSDNPYSAAVPPTIWTVDVGSGESKEISAPYSFNPRWSPHGHRIVFSSGPIATIPPQGGPPVFVTKDSVGGWAPAWSGDGRSIIYCSDRGGSMNLWRVAVDEQTGKALGDPIPLSIPTANCASFSISKDNRSIVYVSRDQNTILLKMAVDIQRGLVLGNPTEIRSIVGEAIYEDVSPDGEWIVFTSNGKVQDLFLVRTDGTELKKLTSDGAVDRGAKWSADSRHLVFFSRRNGTRCNIWMIESDGSNLTQVTKGIPEAVDPALSPVDRILSINYTGVGTRFVDLSLPLDQRTAQPLPFVDAAKTIFGSRSWSPDGKYMAGIGVTTDRRITGLLIFSIRSKTYSKLCAIKTYAAPAVYWLGDNRTLVYQDGQVVLVADRVTRKVRPLFNVSNVFKAAAKLRGISRDGKTLYFKRFDIGDELWMASFQG